MNISVEFCERQTGATTKAIGTALVNDNSVFVIPKMMFQVRYREIQQKIGDISTVKVSDLRGRSYDTIVVDNWEDLTEEEKEDLYINVQHVQPKNVYIFREGIEHNYSDCIKSSIELVRTLKANNFDIDDINVMFKENFSKAFCAFYYDFATEPNAKLKFCKYAKDDDFARVEDDE